MWLVGIHTKLLFINHFSSLVVLFLIQFNFSSEKEKYFEIKSFTKAFFNSFYVLKYLFCAIFFWLYNANNVENITCWIELLGCTYQCVSVCFCVFVCVWVSVCISMIVGFVFGLAFYVYAKTNCANKIGSVVGKSGGRN